jgi:hypothetical protein
MKLLENLLASFRKMKIKKVRDKIESFETFEEYSYYLIKKGFTDSKGYPLKCPYCNSEDLEHKVTCIENNSPCEIEVTCNKCKASVGYWSYGYWLI